MSKYHKGLALKIEAPCWYLASAVEDVKDHKDQLQLFDQGLLIVRVGGHLVPIEAGKLQARLPRLIVPRSDHGRLHPAKGLEYFPAGMGDLVKSTKPQSLRNVT